MDSTTGFMRGKKKKTLLRTKENMKLGRATDANILKRHGT